MRKPPAGPATSLRPGDPSIVAHCVCPCQGLCLPQKQNLLRGRDPAGPGRPERSAKQDSEPGGFSLPRAVPASPALCLLIHRQGAVQTFPSRGGLPAPPKSWSRPAAITQVSLSEGWLCLGIMTVTGAAASLSRELPPW